MTRRRWLVPVTGTLGVAVGVLGTLGVHWLDRVVAIYPETDPGAAAWSCDGAEVLATAALEEGRVSVSVTLRHGRPRDWEVQWDDPGSGAYAVVRGSDDPVSPAVTARTADLDDGPRREVAVRPVGTDRWCRGSVTLR